MRKTIRSHGEWEIFRGKNRKFKAEVYSHGKAANTTAPPNHLVRKTPLLKFRPYMNWLTPYASSTYHARSLAGGMLARLPPGHDEVARKADGASKE